MSEYYGDVTFTYDMITELKEGHTWDEIGDMFGISSEAARSRYRRMSDAIDESSPTVGDEGKELFDELDRAAKVLFPSFPDKKVAEDISWRELISLAARSQNINERMSDEQRTAIVEINTDKPIAVSFSGDWHLGDGSTDHLKWSEDIDYLLSIDNLFLMDLGDDIQNMRSFKVLSGVLSQVLSPIQQAQLLKSIIDEFSKRGKLLAKVRGNHDVEFDERIFGQAIQKYLVTKSSAPMFSNRGLVTLKVGDIEYTILLFHKSRFRSFMRTTHGNYREYQLSYPADIVAGAHDHIPGFETMYHYELARQAGKDFGGETFLIKVGTYQDSNFGWKYFHNGGMCNPTVVLYPDRKKKVAFMNPQDAVKFIQ